MAINKVVDRLGNILVDLTHDTVSPNKVKQGETFHGPDGKEYIGTLAGLPEGTFDLTKYNFIDYDGELMYSFTDEEIDAMEELPAGPDHTDEHLVFQEWNWDLADLKNWNRSRPDRPIVGANLITDDEKTYLAVSPAPSTLKMSIYMTGEYDSSISGYPVVEIDWGDGTIDNFTITSSTYKSHTYSEFKEYNVVITAVKGAGGLWFGSTSNTSISSPDLYGSTLRSLKLGKVMGIGQTTKTYYSPITKCNIPNTVKNFSSYGFRYSNIKAIVVPKIISQGSTSYNPGAYYEPLLETISFPKKLSGNIEISTAPNLKNIVIPEESGKSGSYLTLGQLNKENVYIPAAYMGSSTTVRDAVRVKNAIIAEGATTIGNNAFTGCTALENVEIPSTIKSIGQNAFNSCQSLKKITLPDSVTSIGGTAFGFCYKLVLDLSKQTKLISLTTSIGLLDGVNTILVPNSLLEQYKTANYWSSYAKSMIGV